MPASIRNRACCAISAPWSQVNERRSCSGKVAISRAIASRTASAPCPASAGPFFSRGPSPWPGIGGRCSNMVSRVARSTGAPMAERFRPRIRSPFQCPILQPAAARGRVAPQLPRDGRRRPPQLPGDLPCADALRTQDRKPLPFGKRQVSLGRQPCQSSKHCWWHPARLSKPPCSDSLRHTGSNRRILTGQACLDPRPEPPPLLPSRHRRTTWRPQRRPSCPIRVPLPFAHRNVPPSVATTT